jgi:tRNA nucleotidyltransferase (CCA-adding enzyme)
MTNAYWEHYSHPADIGIRGFGPSKEEAFTQAALALTAIIADLKTVEPKEEVKISCQDQDDEFLFVDWLNAVIYEMATRQMLFSRFDVSIGSEHLLARVFGEKIDVKKHSPVVEVKAATYTDLKVGQDKNGDWVVQCVVDV